MPASSRNCWTIFFIATMLDDPDIVQILRDFSLNNDEYKTFYNGCS